jgi:hypothetical protein
LLAQENLEIRFGGLTFEDIYNDCDSIKYASIADKEIYLYDTVLKKRYDIDSMMVYEQFRMDFEKNVDFHVKGNKFPQKVTDDLNKYKVGAGILLYKIYYRDEKNKLIEMDNDEFLQIWSEKFCIERRSKLK